MIKGTIYIECAYPEHARWKALHESPAKDGWWFAREIRSGQVRSFAPGQLRPFGVDPGPGRVFTLSAEEEEAVLRMRAGARV